MFSGLWKRVEAFEENERANKGQKEGEIQTVLFRSSEESTIIRENANLPKAAELWRSVMLFQCLLSTLPQTSTFAFLFFQLTQEMERPMSADQNLWQLPRKGPL